MDIGNAVYLVTDRQTTGAGVPAVICGLYERSARIAIEREEGTKTFDVPLWDLLTARAYTAAILRVCYSAWETLDRQGRIRGTLREADRAGSWSAPPRTKHGRDVREPLLGCRLDSEESPLRLAESGPVVLSPKSMKTIPAVCPQAGKGPKEKSSRVR